MTVKEFFEYMDEQFDLLLNRLCPQQQTPAAKPKKTSKTTKTAMAKSKKQPK